jgi:glucokinase
MTAPLAIGVDVGGTKIAAGVVDGSGEITDRHRVDSPAKDADAMVEAIAEVADELARRNTVAAIGIGAAGYISRDRDTILGAPNIAWSGVKLGTAVADKTGLPVVVENDANAAAWGEFAFGAGIEADDLVLVTVGTGVGGGIVHDGGLLRGSNGIAAEIGHLRVVPEGRLCGCGRHGCWEQYASGSALVAAARARAAGEPAATALLRAADDRMDSITGPLVTSLALDGDPFCIDLLADLGRWLGEGIASLTAIVDSALVVLGGGASAAGELLLEPTRSAFRASIFAGEVHPPVTIRLATLGNDAGLIGAADLARWET